MMVAYEVDFNLSRDGVLTGDQKSVRGGYKGKPSEALKSYIEVFKRETKKLERQGLTLSKRRLEPQLAKLETRIHFTSLEQIDIPRFISVFVKHIGWGSDTSYHMTKHGFTYWGYSNVADLVGIEQALTRELEKV